MSTDRRQWFGRRAVEWVLDEAPNLPPNLVSTLIGLARHAQDDGSGAGPGVETLMGYTRKSKRQVKYDLDKLRELKLIKVSEDQSRVAHIRADRRPVVYDLAMSATCNPLHLEGARGATDSTSQGGADDRRGAMERTTGCNTASSEVQPIAPEENYEKDLEENNPSLSGDGPTVPAPREPGEEDRERDESASPSTPDYQVLAEEGVDRDEAATLIPTITELYEVRSLGFWRHVQRNRDIVGILARARAVAAGTVQPGQMVAAGREVQPYGAEVNRQPRTSERVRLSAGARKFTDAHRLADELDAEWASVANRPDYEPEVTP